MTNERRGAPGLAGKLRSWGFVVAGTATRPHSHEALVRTVHWLDRETADERK